MPMLKRRPQRLDTSNNFTLAHAAAGFAESERVEGTATNRHQISQLPSSTTPGADLTVARRR